jgi:hypothetical protein
MLMLLLIVARVSMLITSVRLQSIKTYVPSRVFYLEIYVFYNIMLTISSSTIILNDKRHNN